VCVVGDEIVQMGRREQRFLSDISTAHWSLGSQLITGAISQIHGQYADVFVGCFSTPC
jgi:hypothetical protein